MSIQQLKHLRDFMDEENKRWLPTNLKVRVCILLKSNITQTGIFRPCLLVFDEDGNYIGEIKNPKFIPR